MKPIQFSEIENLVATLKSQLVNGQLQEVVSREDELALGFYANQRTYWLLVRVKSGSSFAFISHIAPFSSKDKKPVGLFIKAHLVGKRLASVEHFKSLGRVFRIYMGEGSNAFIEIQLVTHAPNIGVSFLDKEIWWHKPKALQPSKEQLSKGGRSQQELEDEWREYQKRAQMPSGPEKSLREEEIVERAEQLLQKKSNALIKALRHLEEDRKRLATIPWRDVGNALKLAGSLEIDAALREHLDLKLSFSKNLERCFRLAKEQEQKLSSMQTRKTALELDLKNIKEAPLEFWKEKASQKSITKPLAKKDKTLIKARTLKFSDSLQVFVGRNAQENLKLLREARAWDYWVHLREYPGAYALIHREKKLEPKRSELDEIARWVAMASTNSHHSIQEGDFFDVVLAEARFVKPLKGKPVGRVTYHNEKVFRIRFEKPRKLPEGS